MTINGRLLLLVVVTGLFIRVWTTNHSPRWSARNRSQAAAKVWLPQPAPRASDRNVAVRRVSITTRSPETVEETWTLTICPIPLPDGIAGGVYRVVDDTGRMARLEIAPSLASAKDASAPGLAPDFYVTTVAARRWYFIRLQTPADQPVVVAVPEVLQPVEDGVVPSTASNSTLFSNRKFDFTGYVPANCADEQPSPADESPIEADPRPEPPALPAPL